MGQTTEMPPHVKTVVVLGAAYGGRPATRYLAENLPAGWRVVVIDRNTHFNHLYVFPRYAVLPGHAHKGFIPYYNIFGSEKDSGRHLVLNAHITRITSNSVTLSKAFPEHGIEGDEPSLHFDYAIYALGSHMPAPINTWGPIISEEGVPAAPTVATITSTPGVEGIQPWGGPSVSEVTTASKLLQHDDITPSETGTKAKGREWLDRSREHIEKAPSVLVVGGGALGVQFATDIADVYPDKSITLLHSRARVMPRFHESLHDAIVEALSSLKVNTILGDRLDLSYPGRREPNDDGVLEQVVRTVSGKEIKASIILLCTGQYPNTELMRSFLPGSIVPDGASKNMIYVNRYLQIGVPSASGSDPLTNGLAQLSVNSDESGDIPMDIPYPNMFAVGDAADTFGAINAGNTASTQARIAATNIVKLIQAEGSTTELEVYRPGPPGIKMSVGRNVRLHQRGDDMATKSEIPDDLHAPVMWNFHCGRKVPEEEMYD